MDQTSVNLVSPGKKTVSHKGAKQVAVRRPPGTKIKYTVTLLIRANGEKLPAIVVFKTASKNGKLPPREKKKYDIFENVMVTASNSGWWNGVLDRELVEWLFPHKTKTTTIFMRDQFPGHKKESTSQLLEDRNVLQLFIPSGRTGTYQPLDVLINKIFKDLMAKKYHAWRLKNAHEITNSGNMKNPKKQDFVKWISESWAEITPDQIKKAFHGGCWKFVQ